jgi:hypothetical protein
MDPELSRRIAAAFNVGQFSPELRARFVREAEASKNFAGLPVDLQKIVIATETKHRQRLAKWQWL